LVAGLVLQVEGCAMNGTTRSVVPPDAKLIAGGAYISVPVMQSGTYYVVDSLSGQLLMTEVRNDGDASRQGPLRITADDLQQFKTALGLKSGKLEPVLYFAPMSSYPATRRAK
jgi:hypothetical protein